MQTLEVMLDVQQTGNEQAKCLKECFLRDEVGQRALEYLLLELKFLEPCNDVGDMALNNKAKDILALVYGERIGNNGILWFIKRMFKKNAKSPA